jgi:hypothetical protein
MINFKIGDRVKIKHFKNKEDYDRNKSKNKDRGWDYKTQLDMYSDDIFTIKYFDIIGMVITDSDHSYSYWPYQLEKAYSLKDKLKLAKELIK